MYGFLMVICLRLFVNYLYRKANSRKKTCKGIPYKELTKALHLCCPINNEFFSYELSKLINVLPFVVISRC